MNHHLNITTAIHVQPWQVIQNMQAIYEMAIDIYYEWLISQPLWGEK